MACGCAKDRASCSTCLYGTNWSSPWVLCQKLEVTGSAPLQMLRGTITTFSDGTRRVREDALCTEWSVKDAAPVPA